MPFAGGGGAGGGGGGESAIGDWAAGGTVPAPDDFVDTSTIGGATSVLKEVADIGLRVRTDKLANGNDADGDRVQGVVKATPAGNFVLGMRVAFHRPGVTVEEATTAIAAAVCFVDGANVSTASWYSVGLYLSGVGMPGATAYRFARASGASRFESYDLALTAGVLGAGVMATGPFDVFFVREGTTLSAYMGPVGGAPPLIRTWVVSEDEGSAGVRIAHQLSVAHDMQATIIAWKLLDAIPW